MVIAENAAMPNGSLLEPASLNFPWHFLAGSSLREDRHYPVHISLVIFPQLVSADAVGGDSQTADVSWGFSPCL